MNIIDIFFAFFLIYFSYKGFRKGFMLSLIGFCSIFLSIIIALNYSHIISGILFSFFPTSEKLALGFISIVLTFFVSTFLIHKVTKAIKYILDMTLVGVIDDISGAFFGFISTAIIISFSINILQYFDITIFEQEIKNSFISYYLFDLAPNTFALFVDFFPSLEFIVEGQENNEITT